MTHEPDDVRHPLYAEALADLQQVVELVETHTGRTSQWSGSLQVRGLEFGFAGQKHRSCGISIHEDVLVVPAQRWSTMIHEALHSVSGAFSASGSPDSWEEAIVEQMQRIIRPAILADLGMQIAADEIEARDVIHPYNVDIGRLETLRRVLDREPKDFYMTLLAATSMERTRVRIEAQRRLLRDGEGEA